ncbi:MAG: DUF4747 family protein [Pseudomonadota bacterium]
MSNRTIEAGFLNIVATPHPEGVYERLLKSAAEKPVGFWGQQKAAITAPLSFEDESWLSFQLIIWTEIDPDQPTIDKAALKKANFPREGRNFTAQYGVNGRVFYCVFDIERHLLTVELINDDGQTVSPRRLERIFDKLLSPSVLGSRAELVEVTVIPTDDAIDYVLGLARLDKVEILVKRPNQDDITSDTNRVMQSLIDQNAKSEKRVLSRQAKTDGVDLNDENMTLAQVGARSGHVDSSGLDENGNRDKRSTREVPKIVKRTIEKGTSFMVALREIARSARDKRDEP